MTALDTLEFTTSTDFLQSMDSRCFNLSQIHKSNGLIIQNHSLINRLPGVNKININETFGTVRIQATSKILGQNYNQGISSNTLDQFINEINKTGLVLNKDFISDCELKLIHVKNDLKLLKEPIEYINTLNQLIAPYFYKTKYNTGIAFNEKIFSTPIRFTCYAKEFEIESNKSFYNTYPQLAKDFDGVLRAESKLPKGATIRKYFKSANLIDVLNLKNLNHSLLDKVIHKQTNFKPFFNTYKMTNTEEKNFAQIYYLNEFYNGDFNSIMQHIKSKLGEKTKATYQRKKVKKYLSMINNADKNFSLEDINEIREALKEQLI
ncbi:hypothetical protein [Ulvibacter antarcticus]|uniref:Uncharacterized protein n=1 Tax=Ulvibacter antarcticus TaxID=442714 RepID=A0A3L9Y7E6_9FLAO|nr:hypothetical protein [Ulvibacter antarcticus]RMA56646.1 hypothetical protein BXY75_3349 [Ulvibacter antarcticus]